MRKETKGIHSRLHSRHADLGPKPLTTVLRCVDRNRGEKKSSVQVMRSREDFFSNIFMQPIGACAFWLVRNNCEHLFPALPSVMSGWYLETGGGGNVYSTETTRHSTSGLPPTLSQLLNISQPTTVQMYLHELHVLRRCYILVIQAH